LFSDAEGTLKTKSETSKVTLDGRATLKMYAIVDTLIAQVSDTSKLMLDGTIATANLTLTGENFEEGMTEIIDHKFLIISIFRLVKFAIFAR